MNIAGFKLTETDILLGGGILAVGLYLFSMANGKPGIQLGSYAGQVCANGQCYEGDNVGIQCVNGVCHETQGGQSGQMNQFSDDGSGVQFNTQSMNNMQTASAGPGVAPNGATGGEELLQQMQSGMSPEQIVQGQMGGHGGAGGRGGMGRKRRGSFTGGKTGGMGGAKGMRGMGRKGKGGMGGASAETGGNNDLLQKIQALVQQMLQQQGVSTSGGNGADANSADFARAYAAGYGQDFFAGATQAYGDDFYGYAGDIQMEDQDDYYAYQGAAASAGDVSVNCANGQCVECVNGHCTPANISVEGAPEGAEVQVNCNNGECQTCINGRCWSGTAASNMAYSYPAAAGGGGKAAGGAKGGGGAGAGGGGGKAAGGGGAGADITQLKAQVDALTPEQKAQICGDTAAPADAGGDTGAADAGGDTGAAGGGKAAKGGGKAAKGGAKKKKAAAGVAYAYQAYEDDYYDPMDTGDMYSYATGNTVELSMPSNPISASIYKSNPYDLHNIKLAG